MVSERAKEANYFGKFDTPYKKAVPQNAVAKGAKKATSGNQERKGAKPQNAPAQVPTPTPRPDLTPAPTTFAPGGSQMAMPATGNTIPSPMPMPTDPRLSMPSPDPRIMPQITGSTAEQTQPRLDMTPIAGMNLNIPGQPGADPRLQVLQQRLAGGQNPMWPGWPGV